MPPTRTVAAIALSFAAVGCGSKPPVAAPPNPEPAAASRPQPLGGLTPSARPSPTGEPTPPARPLPADEFARRFLAAVDAGTASADPLTPEFRRAVARPPAVFAADQADRYAEAAAGRWLAGLKGKLPAAAIGPPVPGSEPAPGFVGATPAGRFAVRLAPHPGPDGWRVDWLAVSVGPPVPHDFKPGGPAGFAAVAFLEALVGGGPPDPADLMTPRLRADLGPPFASDRDGFNRTRFAQAVADLRGRADRYELTAVDGLTAKAVLVSPAGREPLTLTFVKGPQPWDRLVESIKSDKN